jgi:hypothetical protein
MLTYKFSQDHIELLFSCIRSKGGWNNNPNSMQVKYALRKMLFTYAVKASKNSNCIDFSKCFSSGIIPIFHKRKHRSPLINPLSVATNKSDKKRLILDLRYVNKHIYKQKIKFEDWRNAINYFSPGTYFTKFDLKSGYHHLDIFSEHQSYFGFSWPNSLGLSLTSASDDTIHCVNY